MNKVYFIETWNYLLVPFGVEGMRFVNVLCYRLKGRGFDFRWYLWISSLT
jgi:hypothetical protein